MSTLPTTDPSMFGSTSPIIPQQYPGMYSMPMTQGGVPFYTQTPQGLVPIENIHLRDGVRLLFQ